MIEDPYLPSIKTKRKYPYSGIKVELFVLFLIVLSGSIPALLTYYLIHRFNWYLF